ncbi:hypothetical protein Tco_0904277, partial [Tanacetum coccineum]
KSASEILKIKKKQAKNQKMPKYTIKSTDKVTLKEYDQKSALYQTMHKNKSFNRNHANHRLYHALMEALIEDENAIDKGVADIVKDHKRKHDDDDDDDDEDPSARPNQGKMTKRIRTKEFESSKKPFTTKETSKGKTPSKSSKTHKTATSKEPVKEPIAEVVMDDPVNTAAKDVVIDVDQPHDDSTQAKDKNPKQDWFKQPPRPSTPDLEWNKRQDLLLGPAYNLLKGTCTSSIELEYNFQECFNALIDKLDWNNPEGDRYPFDLSKPLPLQGSPGHLTVASPIKFGYDKDALKWIKHWVERRKLWYRSQVEKLNGHGKLDEIVVKRADRQIYKFKEGDFVDLHLNDIEDMLLLAV